MEIPDYTDVKCERELKEVLNTICRWDRYDMDVDDPERFYAYQHLAVKLLRKYADLMEAELLNREEPIRKKNKHLKIGRWQDEFDNGKQIDRNYLSKTKEWAGELINNRHEGLWQFDNYNFRNYRNGQWHGRYMFNHFVYTEQAVLVHKGFSWKGKDYGCSYRVLVGE